MNLRRIAAIGSTVAVSAFGVVSPSVLGLPSVLSTIDDVTGESDVVNTAGDIDLATILFDGSIGFGIEVVTFDDPRTSEDWEHGATRLEFHIDTAPGGGAERVAALFHDGSAITGAVFDSSNHAICPATPVISEPLRGLAVGFDPMCLGNVSTFGWWVEFHFADVGTTTTQTDRAPDAGVLGPIANPAHVNVQCQGADATIVGTAGADTIIGTAGADVIAARGGDDDVTGRGGADRICLGPGDDTADGGGGSDVIDGGGGVDVIRGGSGNDAIDGAGAGDDLSGGGGADTLDGGPGRDHITGGHGGDRIAGGGANDTIGAGAGQDRVAGGAGHDRVEGGAHVDVLAGNAGDDTLLGNGRADRIRGGSGDDRLVGGRGPDRLAGGPGSDVCSGGPGVDSSVSCVSKIAVP